MNPNAFDMIVTRCNIMEFRAKPFVPALHCCGAFAPEPGPGSIREQIIEFLDGQTDGEDLLHALYDHVLDEAVPDRMRLLFNK